MEWLKELLKNKGIEVPEEVFADVQKELPKHLIPKSEYNAKLEEIKGLNAQISERDGQLEKLGKSVGDSEGLKKQIEQLQEENKTSKESFEKQIADIKKTAAIENEILKANAVDVDMVKVKLNLDDVKIDEKGSVSGLSEQLETVKKDFGFLFQKQSYSPADGKDPETVSDLRGAIAERIQNNS